MNLHVSKDKLVSVLQSSVGASTVDNKKAQITNMHMADVCKAAESDDKCLVSPAHG